MNCNWCNERLKLKITGNYNTVYQCNCRYLSDILDIYSKDIGITYLQLVNNKIEYYDFYTPFNSEIYNIEGSFDDHTTTSISLIKNREVIPIYTCPFYEISTKNGINEALDYLMKIVKLKAFT